jgi:exosortase A-associated hydrolase 1
MKMEERALAIPVDDGVLIGVVAMPEQPRRTGVVVLVGGPQYRAGSHRQFVLLARQLAISGYAVLRFDYRGCGDSTGQPIGFEQSEPDIEAAVSALRQAAPSVDRIVLWGLCDAASAALLAGHAIPGVAGYCLLNPWVRTEATLARTQLRHYYLRRIIDPGFWKKLLGGGVGFAAVRELANKVRASSSDGGARDSAPRPTFQTAMARAWRAFPGPIQLILSGNDYTAMEFLEYVRSAPEWAGLLQRRNVTRIDLADADHTFSSARWRAEVARACVEWLARVDAADAPT